jgi:hypothetical protein
MKMDLNAIKPLMSEYISSGYKKDSVIISSLEKIAGNRSGLDA